MDLNGVMGVIVEDAHSPDLAVEIHATLRAHECLNRVHGTRGFNTHLHEHGDDADRIRSVVCSGHPQLEVDLLATGRHG